MAEHAERDTDEHGLPPPTVWPMVMAAGIAMLAAGIITNVVVLVGGLVLFFLAVWGWVRDLLEEGAVPAEPTAAEQEVEREGAHHDAGR